MRQHKYTQNYPSERKNYPSSIRTEPQTEPRKVVRHGPERAGTYHPVEGNPDEGGKISPAEAERISSEDFPGGEENDSGNKAA